MAASIVCFFLTAAFECWIKLESIPYASKDGILATIKSDFFVSMKFMCKEQPGILKLLFLIGLINFFVMGIFLVGSPYIIRTVLGLHAEYYGVAQSVLGLSAIFGSIAAGMLAGKLKTGQLFIPIAVAGACLLPVGIDFLLSTSIIIKYVLYMVAICSMQIAACIFSVFALSFIQQKTPNHLIGKVMACIFTISMCVQPLGQLAYGLLFDRFRNAVYLVLIPTGIIVLFVGIAATGFFRNLEQNQTTSE